jgi:hypothetical protein
MADASFQQNSPAGEDSFEVVNALLLAKLARRNGEPSDIPVSVRRSLNPRETAYTRMS